MKTRRFSPALSSLLFTVLVLTVLASCQATPPVPQSPVQSSMHRHYVLARDMRTFAVSGEIDLLRTTAEELAVSEESWGMPPGSDAFVQIIRDGATRAAAAENVSAAARETASLAAQCGACHLANDIDLGSRFQTAQPLANGSVSRHMNRLAWASRLLWDGLIGPSDRTWSTGAGYLASGEGFPPPTATHVPQAEVDRSEARLKMLGEEAVMADSPADRVRILAQIWTGCADCHVQAGVR